MFSDTLRFKLLSDHEPSDVLQEDNRNLALGAELDEVSALLRALREEHTVVGDDTNRVAV